jgi:RNA polymerase primary sigma factor
VAAPRFDEADGSGVRRQALEGLLVELVCASLRPVTPADLRADALRLLDERWADVGVEEIDEATEDLEHDALERDRWGFRAVRPARSLDDAWPHLVAANDWADVLSLTEGQGNATSDVRGQRDLFRRPLLKHYEEIQLGARAQRGEQLARNQLVEANTRWVLKLTRRFMRQVSASVEFDDLFQAGCVGLLRAADKFDPGFGYKFSTYATWWILQSINRSIANDSRTIDVPVHIHERLRRVESETRTFRRAGREPSTEELAHLTGLTEQQLHDLRNVPFTVPLNDEDVNALVDRGASTVEETVLQGLVQEIVRRAIQLLPPRESRVLEERHGLQGDPRTLEDIGRELNLTRERVRQIEVQALQNLRSLSIVAALAPPATRDEEPADGN